jgi:Fic family protein
MKWNWQQQKWPHFSYDVGRFSKYEDQFLHNAGMMHGSMKHVSSEDQEHLKITLIREEAFKTSEIEGELLNRDSLQSSIQQQFGLKADHRKIPPAEQGIAEMLADLYQHCLSPLTHTQLFGWHKMLTTGRRDLKQIGSYRSHADPMQIVSGPIHNPKIHYEAPPSGQVKKEMDGFISWFNETGGSSKIKTPLPALTRSGIAHLYFESIHPFEDGNGRVGRALSEKALSQALGQPTLIALAHTIEIHRKTYYEALHRASRTLEINDWLQFFCEMALAAQEHTQRTIDFLIEKGRFYKRFTNQLNPRQQKTIDRIFREGIDGFKGGLSAENYIQITGAPRATVTRDLQKLVELGAFSKSGERKYTRYYLSKVDSI